MPYTLLTNKRSVHLCSGAAGIDGCSADSAGASSPGADICSLLSIHLCRVAILSLFFCCAVCLVPLHALACTTTGSNCFAEMVACHTHSKYKPGESIKCVTAAAGVASQRDLPRPISINFLCRLSKQPARRWLSWRQTMLSCEPPRGNCCSRCCYPFWKTEHCRLILHRPMPSTYVAGCPPSYYTCIPA